MKIRCSRIPLLGNDLVVEWRLPETMADHKEIYQLLVSALYSLEKKKQINKFYFKLYNKIFIY